jgi:serine/threonine protein kinase
MEGLETNQQPSPPLPLPCRFGRYRLTRLLATGGMAQIYLAKAFGAEGFVKPLVIKRLDPRLADRSRFTALFINEAKLLVTLNHGNIVPVFDFGRVDDDLFMAMEYIPGPSLRRVLEVLSESGELLEPQLCAHVATEICKGLDYAHRKSDDSGRPAGIIHRDIKPTNVLISREGEVKIVDFGVAKLAGRAEGERQLAGTLAYMSPEQAELQAVDPRTDIFSTGLVLHELLSGLRAYSADSPLDVLALARKAELSELPDTVPAELREVVERATRSEPADRYATAHEMEQALSEYLLLSRSAGSTMDAVSPASKLGVLIREASIDPDLALADDGSGDEEESDTEVDDEVDSPLPLDDRPPDLALIEAAAETFHSEFMTRVLQDEDEEAEPASVRRWPLFAAGGGALVLVGAVLAAVLWWGGDPDGASNGQADATALAGHGGGNAGPGSADPKGIHRDDFPPEYVSKTRARARARRRRRPRASRAAHGFLNLNSIPWSRVTIDGKRMPRPTPLLKVKLRPGPHKIVLENRERRLRKRITVRIRSGATTWKVVKLR